MHPTFQVDGRLQLSVAERTIDITAEGSRLRAEIGDLPTDPHFVQRLGVTMKLARRLSRELDARELTLVITRNGAPLAELGAGVHNGPLARLFGFSHMRLSRAVREEGI